MSRRSSERAVRQSLANRQFLVIADDVWDLGDVEELLGLFEQGMQVVITRDLGIATRFRTNAVIAIGGLTSEEALKILKIDQLPLSDPNDPRRELALQLLTLPLGAVLVRSALERRLAQGEALSEALAELQEAFRRHEILAFDQLDAANRDTSIGQSLRATISRLAPVEEELLIRIAESQPAPADALPTRQLRRLTDLGLVEERSGRVRIHLLVRAYLLIEGRLDEGLESRTRKDRISSSADKGRRNSNIERAQQIIRGKSASLVEIKELAELLKDERYFTYARLLFARAQEHPEARRQPEAQSLKLVQREALCTYRDQDLPADSRFNDALALLENADLNSAEPSAETLGLAGAIYKYKWKLTGQRRDLERSAAYYGTGAARGVVHDQGYTGINAAFVFDLLAQQERKYAPDVASGHTDKARSVREQITTELPPLAAQKSQEWLKKQWWFVATLAEACFGLGRYSEARYWLREGLALDPPEWQLESTTRQFVGLAVAQNMDLTEGSDAHRVLRVILGDAKEALRAATIGKVGLALSGGGFRASLFHIGVLARMAELDMLRHVEVLSCVSGGSIIGAHYYLEVRRLLQEKPDEQISREDYIEIVQRLGREFVAATQKNLRTRLFASWWANFRTILQPAYTRTMYLGDLFERHIYSRVPDGHNGSRRWLNELQILPNGAKPDFNPKLDNWTRSAKAPILLLNATTLNTGHSWQFAVSWMGEPPLGASSPVDRNEILRRLYYWEAPPRYQRVALGQAVAASACVPFLFDPIELKGLYPDRSVRLVDGGAHDNQGTVGLLEQECTVMLISDASGQTDSLNYPSKEAPSVALRTNDVLMARVREAKFRELELLQRSSALNGFVYLHLKQDLEASQVDWIDCQDPHELFDRARSTGRAPLTSYGTLRPVQTRLAAIRTDLDSFSDTESYALMLSGYRMATTNFRACLPRWPFEDDVRAPWDFLSIEDIALRAPGEEMEHLRLIRLLTASAKRGFKAWRIAPMGMLALSIVLAGPLVGLAWDLYGQWPRIVLFAAYLTAGARALELLPGLRICCAARARALRSSPRGSRW